MPFYSSYPASGALINSLRSVCDSRGLSSFKLSKQADLSPTTTRKIYNDENYIPSPDVLERLCLTLQIQPGDLLQISDTISRDWVVGSGVIFAV